MNGKNGTTACSKLTFSCVCTHFESFLLSTNKSGMLYTLVCIYFILCSDQKKFHVELVDLKEIF